LETTGFSRMEFPFWPNSLEKRLPEGLKLKLHAAEADGIFDHLSAIH